MELSRGAKLPPGAQTVMETSLHIIQLSIKSRKFWFRYIAFLMVLNKTKFESMPGIADN